MWETLGGKRGQVYIELGEIESWADFEATGEKLASDKEWQDLMKEVSELGVIVEGTPEFFLLNDY